MATSGISGPQTLRGIDVRYMLKQIVIARPELEIVVPTLQALGNEVGGAFAVASMALQLGRDVTQRLPQYVQAVKNTANKRAEKIGLTHDFTFSAAVGSPLTVTTTVQGPNGSRSFSYTFARVNVDFSDEFVQGIGIGKDRWALYVRSLGASDLEKIFDLAAMGYDAFLSGDTAKEAAAKLKHYIAMEGAKGRAAEIIQRMQNSVDKYATNAVAAADKYKVRAQYIAYPAVLYGIEYVKAAVAVL